MKCIWPSDDYDYYSVICIPQGVAQEVYDQMSTTDTLTHYAVYIIYVEIMSDAKQ